MSWLILAVAVVAILFGPQLWVDRVMLRYSAQRSDFPGTGGELARHLLDRFDLQTIQVGVTHKGDHYDPIGRTVRLDEAHFAGRSLAAIVIAAHEVGHALQDAGGYRPLMWRQRLVGFANAAQRLGNGLILATPLIVALTRLPSSGLLLLAGIASIGSAALIHLITLPVEWDASFKRALPLLEAGRYIPESDLPAARRILRAAALTYVAGALASLLNLWRWLRMGR
ncbi:MAG TPA: zinc metallopeptidase [Gammaproteobacteria bacterium]